ncbi:protein SNORC-like [Hemiscyllium ocellatum]|uniref:protein SNORC-like n=1 Tax=Hemiscyllium ocellatum TaxID=170820 RepID=UPI002966A1F9|nr:protein SNORC-like [Hemiscyllium ocellatum]
MAQCRRWNLLPWTILGTTILIALSGLASEVQGPLVLVPPNEALEISSGGGAVETVTPGNSVEDSSMTSDYGYFPDDSEPVERGSLGPGAISAIVIAAVLGVSVLFSLIIITVRKLSAS